MRTEWTPAPVQITDALAVHGEGPYWSEKSGCVLWVDMLAGDILATQAESVRTTRYPGPEDIAAIIRRAGPGYVLVGRRGIWTGNLTRWEKRVELPLAAGERANEGGCTVAGSLMIGCMHENEANPSAVYRYDGVDLALALSGPVVSNGMSFDSGGVWFIDSPTRRLSRYSVSELGRLDPTGEHIDLSVQPGVPDGMCRDTDGGFWVAMFGGGRILRLEPNGELDLSIELPVPQPTSCAFGGSKRSDLYITTSAHGHGPHAAAAGALFRCPTPYSGATVFDFAPSIDGAVQRTDQT